MKYKTWFISGIDTGIGKSIATGMMAKYLHNKGINVITQKLIQTGCTGISEDIETHRQLMNIPLQEVDLAHTTCPYCFSYPCSPHLASEIDGITIEPEHIFYCTQKLESTYETVLLEGAGGIMVPITRNLFTIDYIHQHNYPVILVTSSCLGSINHTLLMLEACIQHKIAIAGIVYNRYLESSPEINNDFQKIIQNYLKSKKIKIPFVTIGQLANGIKLDFMKIFGV